MAKLQVAISQDFFMAFAAIPKKQQKKVNSFVSKFRHNPLASGINYEKINDAASPDYRSVRIDQAYRGIVLKPDTGNVYVLLWVDHHDEAYDWARRHRCAVNEVTGSLQLYEVEHDGTTEAVQLPPTATEATPLLPCRDRELRRLGVPDERLAQVKALASIAALEAMQPQLPVEVFEALSFLAEGIPLAEVMEEYAVADDHETPSQNLEDALQRPHSQRRFHIVEGEMELQQMLEAPLEQWRVFLHPTQRKLVERHWNGPVRVLGGAGTGKTVVAMHRARWLVANVLQPDERLLFTTFNRNLAMDIEASLRKICTPAQMKQIEVTNIDAWVRRFLKREGQPGNIVYPSQDAYDRCWHKAMQLTDADLGLADSFYEEEFRQVILPQRVMTRADYFRASRVGRGVPLSRKQRAKLWPVFEEARLQLHQQGCLTAPDAVFMAIDLLEQGKVVRPFRAAIVDEAQDIGAEVMRLIRKLVPEERDDLLIAGDGHQRIYGRKTSLSKCGVNIRGRGKKLKINYRTTERIRRLAVGVLEGVDYDDLDDANDTAIGYKSLRAGSEPVFKAFESGTEEAGWVAEEIRRLLDDGYAGQDICVVGRTKTEVGRVREMLVQQDVEILKLERSTADDPRVPGIRLANMHRVKGLEFKVIFLVGVRQGRVPLELAFKTQDPVEKRSRERNERALLHVAMTRAVNRLYVTWYGDPSLFLTGHCHFQKFSAPRY